MTPDWNYPRVTENNTKTIQDFYKQAPNSIDVLFLGPSTTVSGISPMELYENTNFISYNLGTSGQPIMASYYLLLDALEYQSPKVVAIEMGSSMFQGTTAKNTMGRIILDSMPLSKSKIDFTKAYIDYCDNPDDFWSVIFPIFKYHTRWEELTADDFANKRDLYCCYGFRLSSQISPTYNTVEQMNHFEEEMLQNNKEIIYSNKLGKITYEEKDDVLYDVQLSEISIEYLRKIKELCDDNNIQLLAYRIPPNDIPALNKAAWTMQKYLAIKEITSQYQIPYIDLMYDVDLQYDWEKDTQDGGRHLNIAGAEKTADFISIYLREHYDLPRIEDAKWEYNRKIYKKVKSVAELQMESNFASYIGKIQDDNNKIFFFVCKDEMTSGMSKDEIDMLQQIGLKANFENSYRNSYISIVDGGRVVLESCSNRTIKDTFKIDDETRVEMESSGFFCGSTCSIKINGQEYALNSRGLNIVVYDRETHQVIDTVVFDTSMEDHAVVRNATYKEKELRSYEMYWFDNLLIGEI